MQTDDLAAQMVREMLDVPESKSIFAQPKLEAIARRYIEKAMKDEREECAQICERIGMLEYAAAIRAGKEPPHDR